MKSVKEVSQLSGVSVRTLHYYDEIDLLKPSVVAENGYRYYNRDAVVRLQEILLYRELDFPLKKIKEIVGQPGYDKVQALRDQIKLLELKRSRLEAVIAHPSDRRHDFAGCAESGSTFFQRRSLSGRSSG